MKHKKILGLTCLVLPFLILPSRAEISVTAIQFELSLSGYADLPAFHSKITGWLRAENNIAKKSPDLIVFPEYASAFLALAPDFGDLAGITVFERALSVIARKYPIAAGLKNYFLMRSEYVRRQATVIFGGLAREFGCHVLAGTYFARSSGGALVNRALLLDPQGRIVYTQDKVFLTDFEKEVIGLSPGDQTKASGFRIGETEIGLTICRDSFDPSWDRLFRDKDFWIDIKANGTYFTQQEKLDFERALPARLLASGVPFGLTVCLNGGLFDLFWEGESSFIKNDQGRIKELLKVSTMHQEVLTQPVGGER